MGGGSAKQETRTPSQAPISLQANSIARILEVVSEGQIQGLVNGLNSVYFDDTPLQNKDGTFNFQGVEFQARLGEPDQTEIQGFGGVESVTSVGVKVEAVSPVVRTITNPEADYVRIKMAVPSLQYQDPTTGDVFGSNVHFKIEVNESDTGYKPFGRAWQRLSQSGTQWITSPDAQGFRIVLTKRVINPSEPYMLDNIEAVTVGYRLLPLGTVQTEEYTVSPSGYSVYNASQGYSGTINLLHQNLKMEANGASTRDAYSLAYTLDDEVIGLTPGQYEILPPEGWIVSSIHQLVTRDTVIQGRTTSTYEREYLVVLPKGNGGSPWDIRVTRVSEDNTNPNEQNDLYWTSYAEGVETKLTYANRAISAMKIDASLFGNNLPKRGYLLDGVLVKVPTTYDPVSRLYNEPLGYWDGTFTTAWTNNPVWILYDVLTNERYGGGHFIKASQVDKYSFYECAKYCDELVPVAGRSAMEPRFTFNYWFANNESFYDIVNRIASSFNAMVYSVNDVIILTMDKPKDIVAVFSQANVINKDGVTFQYSSASVDTTSSVVQVRWNDPDKNYEQSIINVEDPDLIEIYGYQMASVTAFGCTSEGQARRQGRWVVDTQKNQYQTISFSTGLQGADIAIGDVIGVYDPSYQLLRMSGRARGFYNDLNGTGYEALRLDAPVEFSSLQTYSIYIMMRDGTARKREIWPCDEDGTIAYANREYVLFQTPLSVSVGDEPSYDLPILTELGELLLTEDDDFLITEGLYSSASTGAQWGINASNLAPREFYVVSTSEKSGNEKFQYTINAVEYDRTKYLRIEQGIITGKTPTTLTGQDVILHSNLKGVGYFEKLDGVRIKRLLLSWTASPDRRITRYAVYYKTPDETMYTLAGQTSSTTYELTIVNNLLDVRVDAIQVSASESRALGSVTARIDFAENNLAPAAVQSFNYTLQGTNLVFTWDAVLDNDLDGYELRYTPSKDSASWDLTPFLAFTTETTLTIPYQDGTFFIKAKDFYGAYSTLDASRVTFSRPDININVVETLDEHPTFAGTKTACEVVGEGLSMTNPEIDDTAYYEFADTIDLGDVYVSRLTSVIDFVMGDVASWVSFMPDVSAEPTMATVDSDTVEMIPNFSLVEDLSLVGYIAYEQGMLELQVSTSQDGTAYGAWEPLNAGEYEARAFKFRLVMRSFGGTRIPTVTVLSVTCDMPDRLESVNGLELTAGWNTITYTLPFKEVPSVQVTATNLQANERIEVQSETASGFEVRTVDATDTPLVRNINWLTRGYGKRL